MFVELDGTFQDVGEYSHFPGGLDAVHSFITSSNEVQWARRDALGNVIGTQDASPVQVQGVVYDPWGHESQVTVSGVGDVTGQHDPESGRARWKGTLSFQFDDEFGLNYMRNRWYEPTLGRFLNQDPIGLAGGLNQYVFAGNDPVNGADPTGLTAEQVVAFGLLGPLVTIVEDGEIYYCDGSDVEIVDGLLQFNNCEFGGNTGHPDGIYTGLPEGFFGGLGVRSIGVDFLLSDLIVTGDRTYTFDDIRFDRQRDPLGIFGTFRGMGGLARFGGTGNYELDLALRREQFGTPCTRAGLDFLTNAALDFGPGAASAKVVGGGAIRASRAAFRGTGEFGLGVVASRFSLRFSGNTAAAIRRDADDWIRASGSSLTTAAGAGATALGYAAPGAILNGIGWGDTFAAFGTARRTCF